MLFVSSPSSDWVYNEKECQKKQDNKIKHEIEMTYCSRSQPGVHKMLNSLILFGLGVANTKRLRSPNLLESFEGINCTDKVLRNKIIKIVEKENVVCNLYCRNKRNFLQYFCFCPWVESCKNIKLAISKQRHIE